MTDSKLKPERFSWSSFFSELGQMITAEKWQMEGYEDTPPHSHEFVEIVLITEGKVEHETIQGRYMLKKGDVVVLRPGSWHFYGKCDSVTAYNLCFAESVFAHQLSRIPEDPYINYLLWRKPMSSGQMGVFDFSLDEDDLEQAARRLKLLEDICANRDDSFFAEQLGALLMCLGSLGRFALTGEKREDMIGNRMRPATRRALRIIEADPAGEISLESMAGRLRMNKSYLARLFKEDTSFTLMDFVNTRRMELAGILLLGSDEPVSTIARVTGWDDANYFARRFKSYYGITPSAYRQKAGWD